MNEKNISIRSLGSIGLILGGLTALTIGRPGNATTIQTKYLANHPGEIAVNISQKSFDQVSKICKLSPAEISDFGRTRQRLVDLIGLQPAAKPPRGVSLTCFIQATPPLITGKAGTPAWPVPMMCIVHFNDILEKDGKPVWGSDSPVEMTFNINNPEEAGYEGYSNGEFRDSQNRKVYFQSDKIGEAQGFPIYRDRHGLETVILTRGHKPVWIPLTQEEFLKLWIRTSESLLKDSGDYGKDPSNPLVAILVRQKAVLAAMSPAQRLAQAMYLPHEDRLEPALAPQGSKDAWPMVVINPEWFDPALPKSAVQLVSITFDFGSSFDPNDPKPGEDGSVDGLRLWEMKRTMDWKSISSLLDLPPS